MADLAIANVVAVIGKAYARNGDGELREINPGDVLLEGETVVTPDGSRVELELTDGNPFIISDVEEMAITRDLMAETASSADETVVEDESVDAILAALESGEDLGDVLEATAAGGAAGGPGGEGSSFIRLGRIAEDTPEFSGVLPQYNIESTEPVTDPLQPVDAIDDFETSNGEPVVIAVKSNDIFLEGQEIIGFTPAANGIVEPNGDGTFTYTPNEGFSGTDTFTYTSQNPTGTASDTASVTIVVELPDVPVIEPLPLISIGDAVVQEGDTALVTISLSKPSDEVVTVRFDSFDGTATVVTGDYDPDTGIATFAPGQTEVVISIPTNVDDIEEGTEFLTVELTDPTGAEIHDGTGVVEIIDDFTPPIIPTISINDVTVTEGQTAVVTVTLSEPTDESVTVSFATANGSALSGSDYNSATGTLTFAPGQTVATVSVGTVDDDVEENTENLVVNLSGATNAVIAKPQGGVTILDNDDPAPPPPPPPGVLGIESGESTREEVYLPQGRTPDSDELSVVKTFTVTAQDGLATLSVTPNSGGAQANVFVNGSFVSGESVTEGPILLEFIDVTLTSVIGNGPGGVYTVTVRATLEGPFVHTGQGQDEIDLGVTVAIADVQGDAPAPATFSLTVVDDIPELTPDSDITESGLADGNVITGVGTISTGADIAGADGFSPAATVVGVSNTGQVTGDTGVGTAVLGSQGNGELILLADGSYTYKALETPANPSEPDVFYYTVEDGDGDFVTTTLTISLDGEPVITNLGSASGDVVVDEDDLDQDGTLEDGSELTQDNAPTASEDSTFTVTASDGIGSLTIGGQIIPVDGSFVGPVDIDTPLGTLSITGYTPNGDNTSAQVGYTYTLDQNTELHSVDGSADDLASQDTVVPVSENVAVVLTDTDTGVDNAILTVGIVDDVPDAQVRPLESFFEGQDGGFGDLPFLVVDETAGLDTDSDGVDEDTVSDRVSSADFSKLFANDATHTANGAEDDVIFGADGPGSVGYSLELAVSYDDGEPAPAGENGVESGLYAVDEVNGGKGEQILLFQTGAGTVEGRLGDSGGVLYFTVALNSVTGEMTLSQAFDDGDTDISIWHPDSPNNYDEIVSLNGSGDGEVEGDVLFQINLTQTVTDADGDFDTATVDLAAGIQVGEEEGEIYAFNFSDDGPSAVNDGLLAGGTGLSETAAGVTIGTVTGLLSSVGEGFGADGEGGVTIENSGFGTLGGKVEIDGSGNLIYTSNHNVEDGDTDTETFTYVLTDADGDQATATFSVTLTDRGVTVGTPTNLVADEDDIAGANGNPGTPAIGDVDQTLTGTVTYSIGDTPVDSVTLTGGTTGLVMLDDDSVTVNTRWDANGKGGVLTGFRSDADANNLTDADKVFTITVLDTDVTDTDADYTMVLLQPVRHHTDANADDLETNTPTFDVTVTVEDADGSTDSSQSFTVAINDDTPTLAIPDDDTDTVVEGASAISGSIAASEGADQEGTLDVTVTDVGGSLDSQISITLNGVDDEQSATVNNGAQDLGTLTVTYTGATGAVAWSFTPAAQVDNGLASGFTFDATLTDADGDQQSDTHTITVTDTGVTVNDPTNLVADEDDIAGANGNPGTPAIGDVDQTLTGTVTYSIGDTPVDSVTLTGGTTGLVMLDDDSVTVNTRWDANGKGGVLTGFRSDADANNLTDADKVFTITVLDTDVTDTDADYTMVLLQPVRHHTDANADDLETNTPTFDVTVTVEDADGSTDSSQSFTVAINDDTPTLAIPDDDTDTVVEGASAISGSIAASEGADQEGTLDVTVTDVGGSLDSQISITLNGVDDEQSATVNNGAQDLGTLTVTYTGATGAVAWSFTPAAQVDNGLASGFTFDATLTDADGDQQSDTHTITVTDTGVTVNDPTNLVADEDDIAGANGNPGTPAIGDVDQTLTGTVTYSIGDTPVDSVTLTGGTTGLVMLDDDSVTVNTRWDANGKGGVLTGFRSDADANNLTDADKVFTITVLDTDVTDTDADYTMVLLQPVRHHTDANADDLETNTPTFDVTVTVEDADGSTDSSQSFTVAINDDTPVADIAASTAILTNLPGESDTDIALDIDLNIDDAVGADQSGTLEFAIPVSDTGAVFLKGGDLADPYTSGSNPIYLYKSGDGQTLWGSTSSSSTTAGSPPSNLVFTIALSTLGAEDTYSFTLQQGVDGGAGAFSSSDLGYAFEGGNDPYAYFVTPNDSPDILLTPVALPGEGGTVNGSANDAGVGPGSRFIGYDEGNDVGEAMRVDYLDNITGDPAKSTTGGYNEPLNQDHSYDTHENVNGAEVTIVGNGFDANIRVKAYDNDSEGDKDDNTGDDLDLGNNVSEDQITTIILRTKDINGEVVDEEIIDRIDGNKTVNFNGSDVTVYWETNSALISGLTEGTVIGTVSSNGFNHIEYYNAGSVDADGNWVPSGTEGSIAGDDFLVGGFGAIQFTPGDEVDLAFDLTLTDADGDSVSIPDGIKVELMADDVTVLDAGEVPLVGTAGEDLFVFELADAEPEPGINDPAEATITNFTLGEDVLDLRDLLQGENSGNLENYLSFEPSGTFGNTTLNISSTQGGEVDQTIELVGLDYNVDLGGSDAAALNALIVANSLLTD